MRYLLSSFLCFLCSITVYAQHTVKGIAQDAEGQALEFANAILLQEKDSSLVAMEMTDIDGSFQFSKIEDGQYIIQISAMGYPDYYSAPTKIDKDTDLPLIQLQDGGIELSEVVVKYKKPPLEQKGGTMIVNVASSIIANSGTAENVLKKVPGVLMANGKITLAGQSGVAIYIDGRPTQYMDMETLLKEIPSDAIEKIEVMNEPDARFDAQGTAGIINIVLKKNVKLGLNGNAYVSGGKGEMWRKAAGVSLNYRNGKINLSNNLSINSNESVSYMDINRELNDETYREQLRDPYIPFGVYLKSGIDYYLNKRHTIGTSINTSWGMSQSTSTTNTTAPTTAFLTNNDLDRNTRRFSNDTYYQFEIDTAGQKFSIDASYFDYNRKAENNIETSEGTTMIDRQKQDKPSHSNIYAFKMDYVKPLGQHMKLETGIKYSHVRIDNNFKAFTHDGDKFVNNALVSNHYIYNESLKAAYLKYSADVGKFSFEAGLRYEDTRAKGYSKTIDSTNVNNISKFFPSASISGPLAGKLGWVTTYSYRINRPSFGQLNPFNEYVSPYTTQVGNPFIKPELTHRVKLSLTFEKQPFINFEYRRTNDEIQLLTAQDPQTGNVTAETRNMDLYERYGASMFFPLAGLDGLSGYGGLLMNYDRYKTKEGETGTFESSNFNFTTFLNASYEFTPKLSAEMTFWYTGKDVEGVLRSKPLLGLDTGIQYKFLDDRAKINLSVDALAYKGWRGNVNFNGYKASVRSDWEPRVVNLRFSYSFGNKYLKERKKREGSGSDEAGRTGGK